MAAPAGEAIPSGSKPAWLSAMENGHQGASLVLAAIAAALVDRARPVAAAPTFEDWRALWDGMSEGERVRAYRLVRGFVANYRPPSSTRRDWEAAGPVA